MPPVYHTQINDVLLAALQRALGRWLGNGAVLVDLEGHGREEIVGGLDLARTIGWFTAIFPVRLELGAGWSPDGALKTMKEQLRQIPQRGVGYGVLRYLAGDHTLRSGPQPQVLFNYLGQVDRLVAGLEYFRFAEESCGRQHNPGAQRRHWLEINSQVKNGVLEIHWTYSQHIHRRQTIAALAQDYLQALREIITHCQSPAAGGCTPSDFPLVRLDQATVDRLTAGAARD